VLICVPFTFRLKRIDVCTCNYTIAIQNSNGFAHPNSAAELDIFVFGAWRWGIDIAFYLERERLLTFGTDHGDGLEEGGNGLDCVVTTERPDLDESRQGFGGSSISRLLLEFEATS
jgi:hypothetical protein